MNIIMSRAFQHQYHQRSYTDPLTPISSPLDFTDRIPFRELRLSNETLGSGSFGTVFKGSWRGRNVAVKQFKTKNEIDSFTVEVKQLSCVKHENIVALYGASETADTAYLIMEYAEGGSLNHLLHECKQQPYDLRHACSWAMQTARGVAYLHGLKPKPIMHRDLKPANLLLFSRGKIIKICDFGTACTVRTQMTNNTGSASYMAPEVFSTNCYHESGDVFSWSIIFWEILARQHPYTTKQYSNPYQILWSVQEFGARPIELENCPKAIWDLITRSWDRDPKKRPTMQEVADEMQFIFSKTESKSSTKQNTANSNTTKSVTVTLCRIDKNNDFSINDHHHHQQQQQQLISPSISSSVMLKDQLHRNNHHHQHHNNPSPQNHHNHDHEQLKFGSQKHNYAPSLKSPSSSRSGTSNHKKALLHQLKVLYKREEELKKSTTCDNRSKNCELALNEFEELKREYDLKKEKLKQIQLSSTNTFSNISHQQHPAAKATAAATPATSQKCVQ